MHSLYFVGDSHVQSFEIAAALGLLRHPARFLIVPGATAVGLRNPESQTQALAQFRQGLLPARPGVVPVIQLGEVDCGFVMWWRAQTHGECLEAQLQASLAAYTGFVDSLLEVGYSHLVLTGAVLPTIRDGQQWGRVARARHAVTASQRDRTDLTIRYNQALAAMAAERGILYTDISAHVLDPETGLLADPFRNTTPGDHHLHPIKAAHLWAAAINSLVL